MERGLKRRGLAKPGMEIMKRLAALFLYVVGIALVAGSIAAPILFAQKQIQAQKNFRVVRDGVFFRSGQMKLTALSKLAAQHGIRTVVSLRDAEKPGDPPPDADEEAWCRQQEITYLRLSPKSWEPKNGEAPVVSNIREYLSLLDQPDRYPMLIHCFAGIHRTGAYTAIYRIEKEGWPVERAMDEMRALGYDRLDEEKDILGFFENYQPGKLSGKKKDPAGSK